LHLFINFRQFSIDLYDFYFTKFSFGSHYAVHSEFSVLCCTLEITYLIHWNFHHVRVVGTRVIAAGYPVPEVSNVANH